MSSVLCVILLRVLLKSATQRQTDAPFRSPSSNCTGIRINITPEIRNPLAQSCFYWDVSEGEVRLSQVALVRQHLLVNMFFSIFIESERCWCDVWVEVGAEAWLTFPASLAEVEIKWSTFLCVCLRLLLLAFVSPVLLSIPSVFVSCSIFSSLTLNLYHCLDFSLHFPICLFHVVFHHRCPFSSSLSFLLFLSFVSLSFSLPPCWAGKPLMWSRYLFMQVIHQHRVAFKAMSRKPDQ